jgi:UDP-N-acetylglucosamine 2-epimerase (non-hydrolysing)
MVNFQEQSLKVCVGFGTRPEAIKLAPVIHALLADTSIDLYVLHTGQHEEMATSVLDWFQIEPNHQMNLSKSKRTLNSLSAELIGLCGAVLADEKPDVLIVQGDTSSALFCALGAFHEQISVAHVEAGLRTHDIHRPFPEELNRVLIGRIASLHFPPTEISRANLVAEGINDSNIVVTGNTVVDALLWTIDKLKNRPIPATFQSFDFNAKNILVTAHRRESWDGGIAQIFDAVYQLALDFPDVHFWLPLHANPLVKESLSDKILKSRNVHILGPVDYPDLVWILSKCEFAITDSGGIQEESIALNKPVLVTRSETDRPEGVDAGLAFLVGSGKSLIIESATKWLKDDLPKRASNESIYGDGLAAQRIVQAIKNRFNPSL